MLYDKVEGFYQIEAFKVDDAGEEIPGTRRIAAPWFKNLITNGGLEHMGGNSNWISWCQVGSGSTPAANTDSSLVSRIAGTNTRQATAAGNLGSSPYYTWRRNTYRFDTGVAAGNVAEVGVGWASTGSLFSRALIQDGSGNPITISVLPDEVLDVIYEIRFNPKLTDSVGTVVLTGNIGGTYDYTMRPSRITDGSYWGIGANGSSMNAPTFATAFTGAIGAITASPSGTSGVLTMALVSYVAASLTAKTNVSATVSQANLTGGIRSIRFQFGIGEYQVEFDPPIPKTNQDVLSLIMFNEWARA